MTQKKILIIQTAFIGDVVLATPLVESLKKFYPKSNIDFLLRKGNETLFLNHPHINNILIFEKKKKKYRNLFKLIRRIRQTKYDCIVNVQRFFTTGLITFFSKAKTTAGFDKNPFSFAFTYKIKHQITSQNPIHEVTRNLALIKHLVSEPVQKPKLYYSSKDKRIVPKQEYICIAPSSTWFTKQFPLEKWCSLIEYIPSKYHIYLIGSSDDFMLCQKIQEKTGKYRVYIQAGQLSFLESVALIHHARMTFTNDSAPLHFASAINAPVTAIFCSTIPQFGFGPLSDKSFVVQSEEKLSCRPCGLHGRKRCPKKHFQCSNIDVKKIVALSKMV